MLQALAPHLPIAPPQSLYLAITQLQHGSCIFQFQCPTVDSPHYPHPLQLTAAHARPHSTRPPVAGGLSLRGHFYSVREGTLSKSFNSSDCTSPRAGAGQAGSGLPCQWVIDRPVHISFLANAVDCGCIDV